MTALPSFSLRFWPVWQRNFLVWKKLAVPSVLGNLADPMLYMLGLGFGIGSLLPQVDGMPYLQFLAAGTLCYSTMNSATFEALYSAFSRMHVQKSWLAIINAPIDIDDVVLAEWLWAASKSVLSGLAIFLVMWGLGLTRLADAPWLMLVVLLAGLTFSAMGLVMTALSPSYDFFMYYFTLVISPMVLLSGVFYPVAQLPGWLQAVAGALPLTQAINLVRPVVNGGWPVSVLQPVLIMVVYAVASYWLAVVLIRRRLGR